MQKMKKRKDEEALWKTKCLQQPAIYFLKYPRKSSLDQGTLRIH
jgi:hypothetical protein